LCVQAGGERKFDTEQWDAYKEANIAFADAVISIYEPKTDMVSEGDYSWRRRALGAPCATLTPTPLLLALLYRLGAVAVANGWLDLGA
jgi:hypothetical protein